MQPRRINDAAASRDENNVNDAEQLPTHQSGIRKRQVHKDTERKEEMHLP